MRLSRLLTLFLLVTLMVVSARALRLVQGQERQAIPRDGEQKSGAEPQPRREPQSPQRVPPDDGQRRAQPRSQPAPRANADRGRARASDRREPPRRTAAPLAPRRYSFPPIDLRLRFYYHPYFGFYYGPYYGPYYPYPGPYVHPVRYSAGAVRLRVRPVEAEVYVNGYYAGIADDFDGVFQRLYLPAGEHQITLSLVGYETFTLPVRVPLGDTLDVVHQMRRLGAGERALPPPSPRALPGEWTEPSGAADEERPSSPYGILALRTDPADARILVDGEAWAAAAGQAEFVIHLPAGWHQLEVRRDGYQPFSMRVELTEGHTTRLDAGLVRQ